MTHPHWNPMTPRPLDPMKGLSWNPTDQRGGFHWALTSKKHTTSVKTSKHFPNGTLIYIFPMNYTIIGFLSNEGLRLDKSLPRLETFTEGCHLQGLNSQWIRALLIMSSVTSHQNNLDDIRSANRYPGSTSQ